MSRKRSATSDDFGDAPGKRLMGATSSETGKAEFSWGRPVAEPPSIDERAELAHKHVRALNEQFASWVQSQMQNHPDELWEDGLQDYLSHASGIMEKFSDVVAWLRKKSEMQSTQTAGLPSNQNKPLEVPSNINSSVQSQQKSGSGQESKTLAFSWSSSVSDNSLNLPFVGNPVSNRTKLENAEDLDEEADMYKPSSPSLKKSEEKGIIVVHEVKCKIYVKPDDPADKSWKDMGMGMLSIKCKEGAEKATKESGPTIIVRNDVGKILLNALLYPGIKTNVKKNTIASIFHTSSDTGNSEDAGKKEAAAARMYLLRTKTEEETTKLAAAINEYAPTP